MGSSGEDTAYRKAPHGLSRAALFVEGNKMRKGIKEDTSLRDGGGVRSLVKDEELNLYEMIIPTECDTNMCVWKKQWGGTAAVSRAKNGEKIVLLVRLC